MGCYLSGLKIIIYKYLFIFKKQYVELRSENMGVYCHWHILFIIILLLLFFIYLFIF